MYHHSHSSSLSKTLTPPSSVLLPIVLLMVIGSIYFRSRLLTLRRRSTNANNRRRRWPMSSNKMSCRKSKAEDLYDCPRFSSDLLWMARGSQVKLRFIKTVSDTSRRSAPRRSVSLTRWFGGLMYSCSGVTDILFSNIKHLFFQPCDNELLVIMHVHLKAPIMIGKKKAHVS